MSDTDPEEVTSLLSTFRPDNGSDEQAIIDVAMQATEQIQVEPGYLAVTQVAPGCTLAVIDLERKLPAPRRKKGTVHLHTAESFSAYVQAHDEGAATTLYGDIDNSRVTAVLNGHENRHEADGAQPVAAAGWGDHRAILDLRLTTEWEAWNRISGKQLEQVAFAEFIEDHVADCVEPAGAEMLELAQTFEATVGVDFASATRLTSGQRQLTYKETIEARVGQQGQMQVPEAVRLGIKVYEGGDPYELRARLRFRILGGALKIGVVLDRPDLVLRDAFEKTLDAIEAQTTFAPLWGVAP